MRRDRRISSVGGDKSLGRTQVTSFLFCSDSPGASCSEYETPVRVLDDPILAIPCKDSLWKRCLADWLEESGGSARLKGT